MMRVGMILLVWIGVSAAAVNTGALTDYNLPGSNKEATSFEEIQSSNDSLIFAPAVNYPGFAYPVWCCTGDLDGDGDVDLAVPNLMGNGAGLLLNHEDGTFGPVVDCPTGSPADRGRVSDLDGDGDSDLVLSSSSCDKVTVLLNHGDATFEAPVYYAVYRPSNVAVSDFDGDGDGDLAVGQSYSEGILIMFNQGDGTFTAGGTYPNGDHGGFIVTSDFDADGDYDFAAGSICSGVWLHFNQGDGTFPTEVNYSLAGCNHEVCVSDLDGDGDDDLVIGYGDVYGDIPYFSVLLNHGDGTFADAVNYPITGGRSVPCAADLDGDGDADLAVASPRLNTVSLLLNHGDGTFSPPVATYGVGDVPQHVCFADFDGDGDVDLATANSNSSDVSILLNTSESVVVSATVDMDPDVLNPRSGGRWVTCYIELPEGYDPGGISVSTVMLNETVPAELTPISLGDHDADGTPDLTVKFSRSAVIGVLPNGEQVEVRVTGEVLDEEFAGRDTIRVLMPKLTYPSGGEMLAAGSDCDITWESPASYSPEWYDVYYSVDDGESWELVAQHVEAKTCVWTVPDAASELCLVLVEACDSEGIMGYDTSDGTFTISSTVGVREDVWIPVSFALYAANPNPSGEGAVIRFDLPETRHVKLVVHDVSGRLVTKLVDGVRSPRAYSVVWDGKDAAGREVPAGVYFVLIEAGEFRNTEKIVLLR